MNEFIFRSRWIAIAFAVMILFSAYVIVSGQHDASEPDTPGQGNPGAAQLAQGAAEVPPAAQGDQTADQPEFVDDGDLIDDAAGDDPSVGNGDAVDSDDADDVGSDSGDFADADTVVSHTGPKPAGRAPDGTPIVMAN